MDKQDLGFFEEVEHVISNHKSKAVAGHYDQKLKEPAKDRKAKQTSELKLLIDEAVADPCSGCPYESKPKLLHGAGDITKAKLLVVVEKISELDLLSRDMKKNDRYKKFLPIFLSKGFVEEDIYWVALSRCSGSENIDAVSHCLNYLRREILAPNIKCILLLGVRTMQLLIDKKRTTIFKARGQIFEILGKSCMVTSERLE